MEKYYQVLILLGVICYRIDQLDCQDSTTGVITDICGEHLYHCKNGVCINETLICNGKRDCQDGDDEENCVAGRTNSSISCAKTNGQCTCVDGYLGGDNKYIYLDLNCTDAGLTFFPKLLNTNLIREIFLKGNKIPKLTARNLNGLDRLDSLILQHNEINTIENDTFRGLSTGPLKEDTYLTRLDLSDNNLTELTAGMFEHLPALFLFSLARNQINTIEKNAFHDIRIGRELDLSGNKLEKLTPGIFNKIDELNTSDEWSVYAANHGMPKFGILRIKRLNLKNNKIQIIEPYTFGSIQDLEHLNLAGNKITKLTSGMFKGYLSLVTLHLEENGIDTIENNTFADFYILNMLYLSRNKLTKLTRGMFNSTQLLLQYLDLRENEIDTIESYTFISFPGIELLDLSYNKLTKLEDHTFKNLVALKDLSLAKNQISHIETSTFHELYELQLLNLTGNPLHEVDSRIFLSTHPRMTVEVDDMNICCQTKKIKCYSPNATYDYCEQLEQSMQNARKVMWYMGIGVLLVAVIIILVAILKFNICGIKKKFSPSPYAAPNDDAQL